VSATNKETCKLDCDSLAETGMDTLTDEPAKATYKKTWQTCAAASPAASRTRS
jgi:hypothetical protein